MAKLAVLFLLAVSAVTTGFWTHVSTDCLVAVSNVTDGVGIKIVCDRDDVVHQRNFPGSFLSPPNTNEIWVENLTNGDQASVRYALLLPMEREIGILEVEHDGDGGVWNTGFSTLDLIGVQGSCQTHFIHRFKNALYSLCISQTGPGSSSLRLYEITLNTSVPEESSVTFESFATLDGEEFTNVVYAHREQNDQYFFVIVDGNIAYIDPSDHERDLFPIPYNGCANVTFTSIQYVVGSPTHPDSLLLLVHLSCCTDERTCSRRGIYYDTYQEQPLELSAGLPYHCPDFETEVVINKSANQFHVRGMSYELKGDGFREGLCFGSWFAYQDNAGEIFVIDLSSSATPVPHQVSDSGCLQDSGGCSAITNMSDILVIQEFDSDSQQVLVKGILLDANFTVIFKVYNSQPSIFALLSIPSRQHLPSTMITKSITAPILPLPSTLNPSTTHSPTSMPKPQNVNIKLAAIISAVVVGGVIVLARISIAIVIRRWLLKKKRASATDPSSQFPLQNQVKRGKKDIPSTESKNTGEDDALTMSENGASETPSGGPTVNPGLLETASPDQWQLASQTDMASSEHSASALPSHSAACVNPTPESNLSPSNGTTVVGGLTYLASSAQQPQWQQQPQSPPQQQQRLPRQGQGQGGSTPIDPTTGEQQSRHFPGP